MSPLLVEIPRLFQAQLVLKELVFTLIVYILAYYTHDNTCLAGLLPLVAVYFTTDLPAQGPRWRHY